MNNLSDRWRPRSLDEMVGQERIVALLRAYIKSGFTTPIIFSGQYGCGKTSLTKIMAAQYQTDSGLIWEDRHPGVIQINAASKTGVKEMQAVLETVLYLPLGGGDKIYIIDEFHALSPAAFNALMETLDTLPKGVRFFFATTNRDKIPDPLLSRCHLFELDPLDPSEIKKRLVEIVQKEGMSVSDQVLTLLAYNSRGSVRDGIKYLEQCSMLEEVSTTAVEALLGVPPASLIEELIGGIEKGDYKICKIQPSVHPYKIVEKLLEAVAAKGKVWVPVLKSLTESIEIVRFGLEAPLFLQIALAQAIYVYNLSQSFLEKPQNFHDRTEEAIKKLFPKARLLEED